MILQRKLLGPPSPPMAWREHLRASHPDQLCHAFSYADGRTQKTNALYTAGPGAKRHGTDGRRGPVYCGRIQLSLGRTFLCVSMQSAGHTHSEARRLSMCHRENITHWAENFLALSEYLTPFPPASKGDPIGAYLAACQSALWVI